MTDNNEDYIYVSVVTGVLLTKDDKYLLVQEKNPRAYGLWNLPAGRLEKGVSIEDNAIKEAKEETGFDVKILKPLGVFHFLPEKPVFHPFLAEIIGGKLSVPEDEILDAKWFTYDEILGLDKAGKIRDVWVIKSIESFIRGD